SGPFALLLPGASTPEREWPPERFARAARHLREVHGLAVAVAGTEKDRGKVRRIAEEADIPLHDLTGRLSLPQLAVVTARSKIVLGNDSGGIHLAAALETPGIAVATRASLVKFHPYPQAAEKPVRFVYPRTMGRIGTEPGPDEAAVQAGLPPLPVTDVETADVLAALDAALQPCQPMRED
ncbi:MAG TPA: glycosyltransferase family 9 protein, partial [Candidatus Methylacidiphilales bacterium]